MNANVLVNKLAHWLVNVFFVVGRVWIQIVASFNTNVRFLGVDIALDKDSNASTLTCDHEAALSSSLVASGSSTCVSRVTVVSRDSSDRERRVPVVTNCDSFVFTSLVEKEYLAMIVANDESTIIEPGMASVV